MVERGRYRETTAFFFELYLAELLKMRFDIAGKMKQKRYFLLRFKGFGNDVKPRAKIAVTGFSI